MMDWSGSEPYLTILLSVLGTGLFAWWRESRSRKDREQREDKLERRANDRQDAVAARQLREWAQQQWWDRKFRDYGDLQQAIWLWLQWYQDAVDYFDAGRVGDSNPRSRKVQFDRSEQMAVLRRSADASHLTLSPKAIQAAKDVVDWIDSQQFNEHVDLGDFAEELVVKLELAMAIVKAEATRDLNLENAE